MDARRLLMTIEGRAYSGWLKDDWQDLPLAQAKGYGLYAVPNLGGDKAAYITSCQSLFVEWDDIPMRQQFARPAEVGLPDPTVCVRPWWSSLLAGCS